MILLHSMVGSGGEFYFFIAISKGFRQSPINKLKIQNFDEEDSLMLFGDGEVNIPEEILRALNRDRLVIFASAGVSRGEPADLDSFMGLTSKIASREGESFDEGENVRPEVYLDQLEEEGKNVKETAIGVIKGAQPEPTDLHKDLLKIFQEKENVRIVTTNYDILFEKAADEIFDERPSIYSAPALPYGDNFKGIVHLHGSRIEGPESLVLTAKDFSKFYIGKSRGSEFLFEMFEKYTVFFIGYSHKDVIMKYLSRGPPPSGLKCAHKFEPPEL